MKLTLTRKLLLVLLMANLVLLGAMGLATRERIKSGLQSYLTQEELQSLKPVAKRLVDIYRAKGSWAFLQQDPELWPRLLQEIDGTDQYVSGQPRPLGPPGFGGPPDFGGPPGFGGPAGFGTPPNPEGFNPTPVQTAGRVQPNSLLARVRVVDAADRHLIGPPRPFPRKDAVVLPLTDDGKQVGALQMLQLPLPVDGLAHRFLADLSKAMLWIAGGSLLLALGLAVPLGRHLLRPVRALTRGTHALTAGDYSGRIEVATRDELGALAHDFNQLAETLERNEKLRRQAMADVSHELRTPLAVLRAEVEAIQDGIRPCDSERIGSLHRSILGMSRLVNDLYELALSDIGALDYRKREIDLSEIAEEAVDAAAGGFADRGLKLEADFADELVLFGDPERLRQVIDNLLRNSLRYTNAGGTVKLHVWRDGDNALIEVIDSAPGVDPEALGRLFDRFYRAESSRNRAKGGAGLGLAICRNIVEAHGGDMLAKPSPLGGVWVQVRLPIENV